MQTYRTDMPVGGATFNAKWTLEHHGVAVPLTFGVDYTIAKILSIGPSFQYGLVFPAGGCAKLSFDQPNVIGNSFCANEAENKRVTKADGYSYWSLGLQVRVTFPPQ